MLVVLIALLEILKRSGALPITVPAPSEVGAAFVDNIGDLGYHAVPTLLSALTGLCLSTVLAFSLAAAAVLWRSAEPGILRFGVMIDSMPLIALGPILVLWVGNGLAPRVILATMAPLFPLLVAMIQGFKAVDRDAADLFHLLAATRLQRLLKLALPSALPYIFAGLKIAAPLAVLGALIAEWIGADRGLGIMMIYALFSFNVPVAWVTILAVCAIAMAGYGLVALIERAVLGPSNTVIATGGVSAHV
jgi:ABC-type nitrate/sulfonate/bicarbonate transport system permease component